MKTRDKSRNEQPQILSIRVNSNDPHDEIMQTKKDKNPKRYRTVRVEDIDGQDKASACPSIEKVHIQTRRNYLSYQSTRIKRVNLKVSQSLMI